MWGVCLPTDARARDTLNKKYEWCTRQKPSALWTIWRDSLCRQQVRMRVLQTKHELKVTNPCNMQSESTALQGAIHDLTNLKQEFE